MPTASAAARTLCHDAAHHESGSRRCNRTFRSCSSAVSVYSLSPPTTCSSLLSLCVQPRLQIGERIVGGHRSPCPGTLRPCRLIQDSCVLVFMAIDAEQLPVAAIQWIVVVVVVLVVHRQLT